MRLLLCIATVVGFVGLVPAGDESKKGPGVRTLAYSPDGKFLVAGSWSAVESKELCYATVWEIATGKAVFAHQQPMGIPTAAFSPDGTRLALGSFSEDALVIDAAAWKFERKLPGHGEAARGTAFSPDGKTLAVASHDGFIHLWDTAAWTIRKTMDNAHVGWIYAVAFSKDGKTLASCSQDKTAKLWDLRTGACLHVFEQKNDIRRILFTADDRRVIYSSRDGTLSIRDRESGKILVNLESGGVSDDISVANDSTMLAYCRGSFRVASIDLRSLDDAMLTELRRIMIGWDDDRIAVRDRTSQEVVALGIPTLVELDKVAKESSSPEVRLRARLARSAVFAPEPKFKMSHAVGNVESVAFSPDGRTLATGGAEGTVRLWNIATGQPTLLLRQYPAVRAAPNVPRSEY